MSARCEISRERLPNRRPAITETIELHGERFTVSFGLASTCDGWQVREVFLSAGRKQGSQWDALLTDACIQISQDLQRGIAATEMAAAFGEDRGEGETSGPPSSPLGAIARMAVLIDARLAREAQEAVAA